MTEKTSDSLIQTVEKLINAEQEKLKELYAQIDEINRRIVDLQRLYPSVSTESLPVSGLGAMPSRMKPANLQLMKWLASKADGASFPEIFQYCTDEHLMDEKSLRIFIRNYKSRRYGLLTQDNSGNIVLTAKGRIFVSRMYTNSTDVDAMT